MSFEQSLILSQEGLMYNAKVNSMKILLANIVYNQESTGKILRYSKEYLEDEGQQVFVAYGVRGNIKGPRIYRFCNNLEVKICYLLNKIGWQQYRGAYFATKKLISIIKKERPNVVHLHCMNSFCVNLYKLLAFLAKNKINTVITHHAEFYYTGVCSHAYECMRWTYGKCQGCPRPVFVTNSKIFANPAKDWQDMSKAFSLFSTEKLIFTSVSSWVQTRALQSSIVNKYKHIVVSNGIDTTIFKPSSDINILRDRIGDNYEKYILHVTAGFIPSDKSHLKGGWYIVEIAKKNPSFVFVIVGNRDSSYPNLPQNVYLWGRTQTQEELVRLYSSADITMIASKRETFSMVTAESLCCGTPVTGFLAGGPESIALSDYSTFVEYGNTECLNQAMKNLLNKGFCKEEISKIAHQKYSNKKMAQQYLDIYKSFV